MNFQQGNFGQPPQRRPPPHSQIYQENFFQFLHQGSTQGFQTQTHQGLGGGFQQQRKANALYSIKQLKPTDEEGKEIRFQLMLRNPPSYAVVSNFGATLVSLFLPDRVGQLQDCVLGFDTQAEYDRPGDKNPYFGCTVGRNANRIQGSEFSLPNGQRYKLDSNCGESENLHGGFGWHRLFWDVIGLTENSVTFGRVSKHGEDRVPGTVIVTSKYTFAQGKTKCGKYRAHVEVEYTGKLAENEKLQTPINLTNHSYFNLAGQGSNHAFQFGVLDHLVSINADSYTPNN